VIVGLPPKGLSSRVVSAAHAIAFVNPSVSERGYLAVQAGIFGVIGRVGAARPDAVRGDLLILLQLQASTGARSLGTEKSIQKHECERGSRQPTAGLGWLASA
jgi:hypothetical protein